MFLCENGTISCKDSAEMRTCGAKSIPAIDIGGTKTMACLVKDGKVIEELQFPTGRSLGPDGWIDAIAAGVTNWQGSYHKVAAAVTGIVVDGNWETLNPATLNLPASYPLIDKLRDTFGVMAFAVNDAQCAAWAQYRFGAGAQQDMVFLTVSTGIGGGASSLTAGSCKEPPVISDCSKAISNAHTGRSKTVFPATG